MHLQTTPKEIHKEIHNYSYQCPETIVFVVQL